MTTKEPIDPYALDVFTTSYIETALWSSCDDNDKPLDDTYYMEDIAQETLARMVKDCTDFQEAHAESIGGRSSPAGHDFWLNRNGHGAGFWDGDWEEPAGSLLDKASREFGEFSLYVGDDGKVYST